MTWSCNMKLLDQTMEILMPESRFTSWYRALMRLLRTGTLITFLLCTLHKCFSEGKSWRLQDRETAEVWAEQLNSYSCSLQVLCSSGYFSIFSHCAGIESRPSMCRDCVLLFVFILGILRVHIHFCHKNSTQEERRWTNVRSERFSASLFIRSEYNIESFIF